MPPIVYRNTKSTIPGWVNTLHEAKPIQTKRTPSDELCHRSEVKGGPASEEAC